MKSSVFKFTVGCSDNFGLDCMTSKTRKGQFLSKLGSRLSLNFPRLIRALSLTLKELANLVFNAPRYITVNVTFVMYVFVFLVFSFFLC